MFRHSLQTGRRKGDPTLSLFVSLYVILLAFFIVMNAISNQETARAVAVLESVERAFERPFPPLARTPGFVPPAPHRALDGAFLVDAGELVSPLAGRAPDFPEQGGNQLSIELDAHRLFFENDARLSEQAARFLDSLASLLSGAPAEVRREALFLLGTKGSEGGLALARADRLGRALEAAGAPPGSVGVGIETEARARSVRIRFRAVPVDRDRITFAPEEGGEGA
ncbi:MAG: hypothetical protein D6807_05725 [Alphaproteobacteria bacterium]|nr:MAG: hypothetical protein D6807_05725 [Alphaproteobacteria bacterium]